ncbi:MAG: YafY family transcriptional regulator, partial [Chloroflexi bacterium]|nr:YafY family transcriptional regulator [Chloroflexota bacterium]
MYQPTTRLLTILELLQLHPQLSGQELARRLEVDERTVRRYVTMLQDMGLPIEAERGRYGGYRLRPGFKLPPLMFNDREALALALGLLLARRLGLGVDPVAVNGAAAKLERVLPAPLRAQLQALQSVLVLDLPLARTDPTGEAILTVSLAIEEGRQLRLQYQAWNDEATTRLVDPYGLVYRAGFWYLPGYCHLRQGLRTFRLDRVLAATCCQTTFTRPADFDPLAHVNQALATTPGIWAIDVLLQTDAAGARQQVPPALGTLAEEAGGLALRCYVQSLPWFAHFLAGLDCSFQVRQPAELRQALQKLAA